MKKNELQGLIYALAAIALFFAVGLAGECDYREQVILNMSQSEYDSIVASWENEHGEKPSEGEIVKMWEQRHK